MEHGAFKTSDMTLATLLAVRGYDYQLVLLTDSKAIWEFSYELRGQDDFDDLVADYNEFDVQVEPRQFMMRMVEIRRELFAFLPSRRRPGAPAPTI